METTVRANGLEFACLEHGSGPLALLVHGFPDNAFTWERQLESLAAAGFRAVAPFLRGYPPTQIPAGGGYDLATITEDVAALIGTLSDEAAYLVGHDWGALAAYGVCAAYPERIKRAVALAAPHPGALAQVVGSYEQTKRSFYVFFFQLPFLPEVALAMNDYAFIERLWRDWSPGLDDPAQIAGVKRTLAQPGALDAALGYYRALFDPARRDPALEKTQSAMAGPIHVPVKVMFGADDGCFDPSFAAFADGQFTGPYERVILPACGHFLHRERPADVSQAILSWFSG
jgi:pimeloyl-ACP methyl ester carboxylesterase